MSSQEQRGDVDVGESHLFDDLWDAHEAADGVEAVIGAGARAARGRGGQAGHGGGGARDAEGARRTKSEITEKSGEFVLTERHVSKCKLTLVSGQEDFVFSEERSERFHYKSRGLTSTDGLLNDISVAT